MFITEIRRWVHLVRQCNAGGSRVQGGKPWPYVFALDKKSHWWQEIPECPSEKTVCPGITTPPATPVWDVLDAPISSPIPGRLCQAVSAQHHTPLTVEEGDVDGTAQPFPAQKLTLTCLPSDSASHTGTCRPPPLRCSPTTDSMSQDTAPHLSASFCSSCPPQLLHGKEEVFYYIQDVFPLNNERAEAGGGR